MNEIRQDNRVLEESRHGPDSLPDSLRKPHDDKWAHRGDGMRCRSCMWFVVKPPTPHFGRCRRHAPTMSGYPPVFANDWCGDHKLDEAKL
jgi:hypothetical protein